MSRNLRAAALAAAWALAFAVALFGRWAAGREVRWRAEQTALAVAGYLSLVVRPDATGLDLDPVLLLSAAARLEAAPEWTTPLAIYRRQASLTRPLLEAPDRLDARTYDRLRAADVPLTLGAVALAPLKDADDWETVGAVAVPVEQPRWWSALLVASLLLALAAAAWAGSRRSPRSGPVVSAAALLLLGAVTYRQVRHEARRATDSWLGDARHLVESAERAPRPPAPAALARIARGARVEWGTAAPAGPSRVVVDELPAAAVAATLPDGSTVRIVAVPREETLEPVLAGLVALALLAAGTVAVGRATADPAAHPLTRRRTATAWAFLFPGMAHLVAFSGLPILFTAWLSVHRWSLLEPVRPFVGLENYVGLARDPLAWRSLANTVVYSLYVPVTAALALALALAVQRRGAGIAALRAMLFLPYVSSVVAVAIVWQWMYHPDVGLINYALSVVRIPPVDWLGNPKTALLALMLLAAWVHIGYQTVIFVAGLQGIPATYLDAARVDGAGAWQRLRWVTLPLLKPVTLFVLVTGVIGSFQVFTFVYVMTEGNPLHATDVIVYRIYQLGWEFLQFGPASALSLVLTGVLLGATWLQFRLLGRQVEYA